MTDIKPCASPVGNECQLDVHVINCGSSTGIIVTPMTVTVPKSSGGGANPRMMVWKIQTNNFIFARDGISNIRNVSGATPPALEFTPQPSSSPNEFRILNNNSSATLYKYDVKVVSATAVSCETFDPFIRNNN